MAEETVAQHTARYADIAARLEAAAQGSVDDAARQALKVDIFALFKGVDSNVNPDYCFWVSHNVFSMYQLMFAIITPALILGAIAERMKFSAILLFMTLWMVLVYFPLAHWVWGINGAMNGVWNKDALIKSIDFAGGTVVHMSSGWSALRPATDALSASWPKQASARADCASSSPSAACTTSG